MESKHELTRKIIVDFLRRHINQFSHLIDTENLEVHLEDMATEGTWGTTSEIFAAATLLQRDIFVFVRCQSGVYTWTRFKPLFVHEQIVQDIQLSNICSYISICNTDAVHFDIVHPLVGCNCHWPKPKLDGSTNKIAGLMSSKVGLETLPKTDTGTSVVEETCSSSDSFGEESRVTRKRPKMEPEEGTYPRALKDDLEVKFSDSLFEEIKSLKRTLHTSKSNQETYRKELKDWKSKAEQAETSLDAAKKRLQDKNCALQKIYKSLNCCSCTNNFDTLDREPFQINCRHIACSECVERAETEEVVCRLCRTKIEADSKFSVDVLLSVIKEIEKQILD